MLVGQGIAGDPLGESRIDQFGRGGFPDDGAVNGVVLETGGDHLDALVEVRGGLDVESFECGLGDAVRATALRGGNGLAVKPGDRIVLISKVRRIWPNEEYATLVL